MIRVAGCTADAPAIGSIEFAAQQFGCTVLGVMGHQHCGAVKAACSGDKVTSPNLKAVVKPIRHTLATYPNATPDLRDVEKLTVATTVQEIMDRSEVLYRLAKAGRLWVVPLTTTWIPVSSKGCNFAGFSSVTQAFPLLFHSNSTEGMRFAIVTTQAP